MLSVATLNGGVIGLTGGIAVIFLLWTVFSFWEFRRRGSFFVMPLAALTPPYGRRSGAWVGTTRRGLYIFTAARLSVVALCVVLGLTHLHMPYSR